MAETQRKSDLAFRTIGELASDLGVPQHILRYWETRFPQLKPLQRAGNRRYYRPDDVALAKRIHRLLNQEGYTIRGVQQLLRKGAADAGADAGESAAEEAAIAAAAPTPANQHAPFPADQLRAIRKVLADALAGES
jgi:DNA-binding transcriptional MerR regulator